MEENNRRGCGHPLRIASLQTPTDQPREALLLPLAGPRLSPESDGPHLLSSLIKPDSHLSIQRSPPRLLWLRKSSALASLSPLSPLRLPPNRSFISLLNLCLRLLRSVVLVCLGGTVCWVLDSCSFSWKRLLSSPHFGNLDLDVGALLIHDFFV